MTFRRVILESPYASKEPHILARNEAYARAAMRDCLMRGEAPYASHLLYTQPGVLIDGDPEQRKLGIEAGFAWRKDADATVIYTDLGMTPGMELGFNDAKKIGRPVEIRSLDDWYPGLLADGSHGPRLGDTFKPVKIVDNTYPVSPKVSYPTDDATNAALLESFVGHKLDGDQDRRAMNVREHGFAMSKLVLNNCPPGRQRLLALTKIEEAVMWAVKAIALEKSGG